MSATAATTAVRRPGDLLAGPVRTALTADEGLWGFGGLHGGLSLALLTAAMREQAGGRTLHSVTGRYHRPLRGEVSLDATTAVVGRTTTTTTAAASTERGRGVDASAVFGVARSSPWPAYAPVAPPAPRPEECDVFTVPPELVPFAVHTEIRPVGANLPFAGGDEPELTAWVRLVEDDAPPDLLRFLVLVDCLAPSYAAVMTAPDLVPTVELTVRPGPALAAASSPWVLLRATTRSATGAGWIDEGIDAWGPDGAHLGSAHQLRVVLAAR